MEGRLREYLLIHCSGCVGEAEEAEYAWLPVDCMKPFRAGDETGNADGSVSQDGNLLACVGAADAARRREEALGQQAAQNYEDHTDSDGGAPSSQHTCIHLIFSTINSCCGSA